MSFVGCHKKAFLCVYTHKFLYWELEYSRHFSSFFFSSSKSFRNIISKFVCFLIVFYFNSFNVLVALPCMNQVSTKYWIISIHTTNIFVVNLFLFISINYTWLHIDLFSIQTTNAEHFWFYGWHTIRRSNTIYFFDIALCVVLF